MAQRQDPENNVPQREVPENNVPPNYLPAGYHSDYESDYNGDSDRDNDFVVVEEQPMDRKKRNLIGHLKNRNLSAFAAELDREPRGFDIDTEVDDHWNLLFHACYLGYSEFVDFLLDQRGADANKIINEETPLMIACYAPDANPDLVFHIVKALTKKTISINAKNRKGTTALMNASQRGYLDVVRHLALMNASLGISDNVGQNALFYAIIGKDIQACKILIKSGIKLEPCNMFGVDVKEFAVNEGFDEFAKLFPPEPYRFQTPAEYVSYRTIESLVPGMSRNMPDYFPDLDKMLRAMDCEKFITSFALAKVTLEEFLCISDERLKDIGIRFPFERARIQYGLLKFQKIKWSRKSLYIPELEGEMNAFDMAMLLVNLLRQLIIIKSNIVLMKRLLNEEDLSKAHKYFNVKPLSDFQSNLSTLQTEIKAILDVQAINGNPLKTPKKGKLSIPNKLIKLGIISGVFVVFSINVFKLFMKK